MVWVVPAQTHLDPCRSIEQRASFQRVMAQSEQVAPQAQPVLSLPSPLPVQPVLSLPSSQQVQLTLPLPLPLPAHSYRPIAPPLLNRKTRQSPAASEYAASNHPSDR